MSNINLAGVLLSSLLCVAALQRPDAHQYPLFEYETNPLTQKKLDVLLEKFDALDKAPLFNFDDDEDDQESLAASKRDCKAFPGDSEWPSQSTWATFDKLLGGALIETLPVAASCYLNLGVYDAEKCAAVRNSFTDPYFHENDPTSIFWPLYQGRTCMPTDDPESGECTWGGFPVQAVNVSSVRHIQLAVNFARNANLRLVIKNTGHCYLGKSSGAGALSIWMHNLKDLKYYPHIDIPGYSGPAMKVGAGVTVREVYAEADRNDVSALGGICESVGYAGGYIAGGGHTPLSGLYGMAADHVMALEVVTADGRFITASPKENKDLYWALRGGGGSTFGVVTSVIIRVHPKLPVTISTFTLSTSPTVSADAFWEALYTYFSLFIPFTDAGTYSWFVLSTTGPNDFTFSMEPFFAPNHTVSSFNALIEPLTARLKALGIPFRPNTTTYPSFYAAYNATWGSDRILNSAGGVSVPSNRLLPRRNWEDPVRFNATFGVIRAHVETGGRRLMGYHQAPRNRAGVDNAVNSAFRETVCMLILSASLPTAPGNGTGGRGPTDDEIRAASRELRDEIIAPLRKVAPESEGGGAYLNEANIDEPEWQRTFYGVHYEQLLRLKRKWDPKEVFYATTAVGSEGWEVRDGDRGVQTQDGKLCRV